MFRNVYKEANDCIKGDREILDRAFLQAAQIEKRKSPVMRFSVIGTAVTAVLIMGAVFMNSELFFEREINEVSFEEEETGSVTEIKNTTYSETVLRNVAALEDYKEIEDGEVLAGDGAVEANLDNTHQAEENVLNENIAVADEENVPENNGVDAVNEENVVTEKVEQNENTLAFKIVEDGAKMLDTPFVANELDGEGLQTMSEENVPAEANETYQENEDVNSVSEEVENENKLTFNNAGGGGSSSAWSMRNPDPDSEAFSEENSDVDFEDEIFTEESLLTEADIVRLAQEICTIEYVGVNSIFDESTALWTVTFTSENGAYQSVVLDERGILQSLTEG